MNNSNRVQNIFISDGSAMVANDTVLSTANVASGKIGVFGPDMKALNPAGGDTIGTAPYIYIVESKTATDGTAYIKRSMKIDGAGVKSFTGSSYIPAKRNVWTIGHNRDTGVGTIEVANSTNYNYSIRFKNDKFMYSERPEMLNVNFTSASAATQLTIATQITSTINSSSFRTQIQAVVIGDGTGIYGLTNATDYGVEIWSKPINQFTNSTYTPNQVYFSVHVNDESGFGTSTTCTEIQAPGFGTGIYNQVRTMERKDMAFEGGNLNLRQWPIPELDYSSTSTLTLSAAIGINVAGNTGEDTVTFSSSVAAVLRAGEQVEIDGVNYEIKYFVSTTVAVLTSVLTTTFGASDVCKVRTKYDLVIIEFDDTVNTAIGTTVTANKSVVIAVPALDTGDAYSGISAAGQDVLDILNAWMITTPYRLPNITI